MPRRGELRDLDYVVNFWDENAADFRYHLPDCTCTFTVQYVTLTAHDLENALSEPPPRRQPIVEALPTIQIDLPQTRVDGHKRTKKI